MYSGRRLHPSLLQAVLSLNTSAQRLLPSLREVAISCGAAMLKVDESVQGRMKLHVGACAGKTCCMKGGRT